MPYLSEEDFEPSFSERARSEGRALFEDGKVQWLEDSGDSFFEAKLPFFRRFQTAWIEKADDGSVSFECTCPELENEGSICAHVFALMLSVNRRKGEDAHGDEGPPPIRPWFALSIDAKGLGLRILWSAEANGALQLLPADGDHLARIQDPRDQRVLKALQPLAGGRRSLVDGGGFERQEQPWTIPVQGRGELLALAADTERLRWVSLDQKGKPAALEAVELDLDQTYDFVLGCHAAKDGKSRLQGELHSKTGSIPLDGSIAVVADHQPLARLGARLVQVEAHDATNWLKLFASAPDFPVRPDEVIETLGRLAEKGPLPRVRMPGDEQPVPVRKIDPVAIVRITRRQYDVIADVGFRYGSRRISIESGERLFFDPQAKVQVPRDQASEMRALERVAAAPGLFEDPNGFIGRFQVDAERLDALCAWLMDSGCEITVDRRALKRPSSTPISIESQGIDWFQLEGSLQFDTGEEVPLDQVLAAHRDGQRFVRLANGGEGLIPAALAAQLDRLRSLSASGEDALRFSRAQALLLDPFLETSLSGPELEGLRKQRTKLLRIKSQSAPALPSSFRGELRPYQQEGLAWMRSLAEARLGGVLADDMGLGKTVQVLALLTSLRSDRIAKFPAAAPALVVAPRSLLWNWDAEAQRFAPDLDVLVHHGPRRSKEAKPLRSATLVLTSYGTMQRDQELLASVDWSVLILDEAQAIKNPDAKSAKAVRTIPAALRLSVTGTPVENRARDLWSQMEFLNAGLLGTSRRFQDLVASRDTHTRDLIGRAIQPLILRRTKEQVAPELPEKVEQTIPVGMSAEQVKLYGSIREAARKRLAGSADIQRERMPVLEALLRLRQAACHPGLVDPQLKDAPSAKIDLLLEELGSLVEAGKKALVFSQFTQLLDLVSPRLEAAEIHHLQLTGKTKDRAAVVQQFQEDDELSVLLISLKAGGTGLNLTAADYVFILDPWWNPAAEAQAIDRAHRIGRERKVMALRLVASGTVEERILELQANKRALADALIDGDQGPLTSLSAEDLDLLLGA